MWHYVLSRICRNLHRDIEIDRNQRFEEIRGGQKIFIFRGWSGGGGGAFPMRGRSENF